MSRLFGKGNNYFRQLGVGSQARYGQWTETILNKERPATVKRIECFGAQSACVTYEGEAYHWGYEMDSYAMIKVMQYYKNFPLMYTLVQQSKLLSSITFQDRFFRTPKLIPKLPDTYYVDFRLGSGYMILRDQKGQLHGYGDNRMGMCGVNTRQFVNEPEKIELPGGDTYVSQMDSGFQFTLVLTSRPGSPRNETAIRVRKEKLETVHCDRIRQGRHRER